MITKTSFHRRLALLKNELRKRKLDAFLVTKGVNVSYLSGFPGHDAVIVVTNDRGFFITDSRYIEEAKDSITGFDVRLVKESLYRNIEEIASQCRIKKIGFESTDLSYAVVSRLKEFVPKGALVPVREMIEDLRAIKSPDEITLIRASLRLTKDVFKQIERSVGPAETEGSLTKKIEMEFLNNDAKLAFDPIVASGTNSSKPHAMPTKRRIAKNDVVMIDMGCVLEGYNSDITRIVRVGKALPRLDKVERIVRTAQKLAADAVRPGIRISEVDAVARGYIKRNGFGKYFGHALGHGVGMEVHERPTVSAMSDGVLLPGMVFTIEPAIYIPKAGGIRIEDMVLVTDNGCEVL